MIRFGQVTMLRPNKADEYRRLHSAVPTAVLDTIASCGIKNYSILMSGDLLFAYFEYHGTDWDADQQRMAADPATQRWWLLTAPCQQRLDGASEGAPWSTMDEVFHHD